MNSGNAAIIESLQRAVETIDGNTRTFLDFYLGQESAVSEDPLVVLQSDISTSFLEMKQMLESSQMNSVAVAATSRSLSSFMERWQRTSHNPSRGNASALFSTLAREVDQLHTMLKQTTCKS